MGESSRGEAVSSGFRVGKVSTSFFPRTAVGTDAAGDPAALRDRSSGLEPLPSPPPFRTRRPNRRKPEPTTCLHHPPRRQPPLFGRSTRRNAVSASWALFLRARAGGRPCSSSWRACRFSSPTSPPTSTPRPSGSKSWPSPSVLGHTMTAKAELYLVAGGTAAVVVGRIDDRSVADQRRLDGPGDGCCCDGFDRRRDVLWVSRLESLADIRALAASADVRRNGSAPRQGRWILRFTCCSNSQS